MKKKNIHESRALRYMRLSGLPLNEEADVIINYENADELEPVEDAWAGGENLSNPIDHVDAAEIEESINNNPITEAQLKRIIQKVQIRIQENRRN